MKEDLAMLKPHTQPSAKALTISLLATLLTGTAALAAVGTPPSVIAMSQKLKGDAVSITYAYMPKDGTLAIYSSTKSGKMGKPVGHIALSAGDHRDISVDLRAKPARGTKLWAVLEKSGTKSGVFKDKGTPAEQSFKVL
jgi:hypothetical protein